MEIEIVKEIETPLLSRKRVTAWATFQGPTPSRVQILKEAAKVLKTDEGLISIRHIYTRFGHERVKLIIHVYNDQNTMVMLEGKGLADKHKQKKQVDVKTGAGTEKKEAEFKEEKAEKKPKAKEEKAEEKPEAKEEKAEKKPEAKEEKEEKPETKEEKAEAKAEGKKEAKPKEEYPAKPAEEKKEG